ncbi:LysM peptidoglycan-binding domain-containing protein [Paenibacillus sedimenti]|uniref:LysM peptidoglycan-binding domain-containing protein n=1 Tax=Paenibacillus sedimenti TaxID=2770274 RepID=A0A926KQE1_9BACL|nr:LysM peptidoglycan-binding domain-containing protein [Paenibacillus sedimenti]MBD0380423.1 LysM peptidoglycan-binding domain-containing protein [Paenibacillus sedimenti]
MYIAYSHTNTTQPLHRSHHVSKQIKASAKLAKKLFSLILLVVILGTVFSFGAIVQAYAGDGESSAAVKTGTSVKVIPHEKVVVQRGDTLWKIASSHLDKGENIRSYIDRLYALNHLSSSSLQEGQVLLLP